jgi:hypothetical protein
MNKETLRMQMLAGIITESQYKVKLNENITELEVKWTPEYYERYEKYGDEAYDEKGLANRFQMRDGKKVKEIIGYYVPEDAEKENDEEFDIIGYIYSTSGKDIESYSEDELDDTFMNALNKGELNENRTAEELFQIFKDEDLLNDRREYDIEDLMSAYPDLSQEEAEKLEQMLQNV